LQNSIQLIKGLRAELSAASLVRGAVDATPLALEYRWAFNICRQTLAFAGLDGRIWEANNAFCLLLGYAQEETTSLTILSVTAREDSELSLKQ
ncbi:PAS domain S-box protein, partial [bacterium LRH843]|nr:PAS domain S-box protein [bacterium LRH843]